MTALNHLDCPVAVRRQIEHLLADWQTLLGDNLIGLYLHGSLAMGCFNPTHSDADLLAVTGRSITPHERKVLLQSLLTVSNQPAPIEISSVNLGKIRPWRYPTPYDLHYSETWREKTCQELSGSDWQAWNPADQVDPDLAAHVAATRARGRTLWGLPAQQMLPEVPPLDLLDSIRSDLAWARQRSRDLPVYAVLNHCRALAFVREGKILSKREGGEWALTALPQTDPTLVQQALYHYSNTVEGGDFSISDLVIFFDHIELEIERALQN